MTLIKYQVKDNAYGQLLVGISAVATTITLKSGNGANFPVISPSTPPAILTLIQVDGLGEIVKSEQVQVTNRSTDTLTVTRGFAGTVAQAFNADDYIYLYITATVTQDIQEEVERLETDKLNTTAFNSSLRNNLTANKIIYVNNTGDETEVALGANNTYLMSAGPTSAPTFSTPPLDINGQTTDNTALANDDFIPFYDTSENAVNKRLAKASTTQEGLIEIATDAEALAGTDEVRAINAKQLKSNITTDAVNLINIRYYGDGSDGNVTISTNTTLTRDMYYNNLVINSGITLTTAGYAVYVKGSVTGTGTIFARGNNASGSTAGTAQNAGTLNSTLVGGDGGAGALGSGTVAQPGGVGSSQNPSYSNLTAVNGTVGGSGGGGGLASGGAGGTAGTNTRGDFRNKVIPLARLLYPAGGTLSSSKYGIATNGGSGGGGCHGVPGNSGGAGGGAGGNGGIIHFYANTFSFTGTVNVSGGTGGNGANGVSIAGGYGMGGGGGPGGNGGAFVLVTSNTIASYTFTGTGGTGGTGGQDSSNGSLVGTFAGSGGTGNAGFNIQITV